MSTIHLNEISKQFGEKLLFKDLSLSINDRARIGIIGPNGKGKSTFLKIIAGIEDIDSGEIHKPKSLVISYAEQLVPYKLNETINSILADKNSSNKNPLDINKLNSHLDRFGINDFDSPLSSFSGGQRKKIQLSFIFSEEPDFLLLDEPSNHLDMESIIQLEQILNSLSMSILMISHDRKLLESFSNEIIEINPIYPECYFHTEGNYKDYLEKKEAFLESDARKIESMKNKARTELEWLRQGVKARGTKAKFRSDSAHALLSEVETNTNRRRQKKADIEFSFSGRKTKDLVEFEEVSFGFNDSKLFTNLSFKLCRGDALGILGPNGSGKSTFIRLIQNELTPTNGLIKNAGSLSISYFSQFTKNIDDKTPMQKVLAPDGDSVIFNGNSIHVAAWASRFGFDPASIKQPYGSLSGGEKARLRIASLMLESPDLLLLDEPTNDLDIMTLEVLEESLINFSGAIILISHDRYMLESICSSFIGLDGDGGHKHYASCEQYLKDIKKTSNIKTDNKTSNLAPSAPSGELKSKKKKLSFNEQRELSNMEENILKAENEVEALNKELSSCSEQNEIQILCDKLAKAQEKVDKLYKRWTELEAES